MAKLPATFDWKNSFGHLEILRIFSKPRFRKDINYYDLPKLGESRVDALSRLIREEAIIQATTTEKMNSICTKDDLIKSLKEFGERTTGSKSILIERLINKDPEGVQKFLMGYDLFICSPIGIEALNSYEDRKEKADQEFQKLIFDALLKNQYSKAEISFTNHMKKEVSSFEQYQYKFYDWKKTKIRNVIEYLPISLERKYQTEELKKIQVAIAMKYFWEEKTVWEWLPEDFPINYEKVEEIVEFINRFQEYIELVSSNWSNGRFNLRFNDPSDDSSVCESCRELDGIIVDHNHIPDWPLEGCKNKNGCIPFSQHAWDTNPNIQLYKDLDNGVPLSDEECDRRIDEEIENYRVKINPKTTEYLKAFRLFRQESPEEKIEDQDIYYWANQYLGKP